MFLTGYAQTSDIVLENLESLRTNRVVRPGVGLGKVVVGKTRLNELLNDTVKRKFYYEEGIEFSFENGDTLAELILHNTGEFVLESGQNIGVRKSDIISVFGTPLQDKISLNKGEVEIGQMDALIYSGIAFIIQGEHATMITIMKK